MTVQAALHALDGALARCGDLGGESRFVTGAAAYRAAQAVGAQCRNATDALRDGAREDPLAARRVRGIAAPRREFGRLAMRVRALR